MPSSPVARIAPPSSAPTRPNAGAYGEADPFGSSSGPRRVPMNAPAQEAGERERADDEPLAEAEKGEDRCERDN